MSRFRFFAVALLCLALTTCATIRPEPPEVQLAGLEITDLSLSHANFLAKLKLYNPNSTALDIRGLTFTLFLNDVRIANGKTAKAFNIPSEAFGDAALHLSSSYLNLLHLSTGLQGKDQISFRIAGEVKVGGLGFMNITVPIDREGTLPLTGTLQQLVPGRTSGHGSSDEIPGQELILGK